MSKIKFINLILIVFLFCEFGRSQMVLRVNSVPQYFTPLLDTLYVAGNFNGWAPGDASYALSRQTDGNYETEISGADGDALEFKFTRGDWDRVEVSTTGADIDNREAVFSSGDTLTFDITAWHDATGNHTISGNVIELDYNFYMPELESSRRIWIYFPPDYNTSENNYPVIYMQDGQNIFDYASSFAGEWDIDGSMENIFSLTSSTAIVVGIANGEGERINEYSPWIHPTYGGGKGDAYAQFIVNELKPYIDANYRTLPDRENTVIGGSSLGALIAYYMVLQYDDVFGKAMLMSPSFWFDDSVDVFANDFVKEYPFKIYITAGLNEDEDMVPDIDEVKAKLMEKGFTDDEIISVIRSDGAHSEWFWKREYDDAYYWLFGIEPPLAIPDPVTTPSGYYDMQTGIFHFSPELIHKEYILYNAMGVCIASGRINDNDILIQNYPAGIYFMKTDNAVTKIILR